MVRPMRVFAVGGSVRDSLLNLPVKDIDLACEVDSFSEMRDSLVADGFEIYVETPKYYTIRCRIPEDHIYRRWAKDADFTMCRKDGEYSDGRHPDTVEPGTILEDLARRDFTMNAIAIDIVSQEIIDPFGGIQDTSDKVIKCVGEPTDRFGEDPLRALRALRFSLTKGMRIEHYTKNAMTSYKTIQGIQALPIERVYEEMRTVLSEDVATRINVLIREYPVEFIQSIFRDGMILEPKIVGN